MLHCRGVSVCKPRTQVPMRGIMSITERSTIVVRPYDAKLLEATRNFLSATLELFGKAPQARLFASAMLRKYPEHANDAAEAAKDLSADVVDVMLANLSYDLLLSSIGCSTLAFAAVHGPEIARNMDWFPPSLIAKASALIPTDNGVSAGFIGSVGVVSGMSHRGFGLVLNAASNGQSDMNGYPVLLFLRHVLDCANSYDDALEMVRSTPLMSGGLITIVGIRNDQRAIVERTPSDAKVRLPRGNETLIATNHFRLHPSIPECSRYAWLSAHVDSGIQPLEMLTNENVRQPITAQHVFIKPLENEIRLFVPTYLLDPDFKDGSYDLAEMLALDQQM